MKLKEKKTNIIYNVATEDIAKQMLKTEEYEEVEKVVEPKNIYKVVKNTTRKE